MCGLCGTLGGGAHWADGFGSEGGGTRRQARREHVALANRVLAPGGLALADWHGAQFVLRSRTGATALVGSLDTLWSAADRLGRVPVDPLDPALLETLGG